MERRVLGRTGDSLSIIGFGGIVVKDASPADADRRVGDAIGSGVNYFDVAPSYGDAEEKLGPALVGRRDSIFLACKTTKRTADEARAEMENSLRVLQTDRFDLYQLHAITSVEEVEVACGPRGALEAILEARAAGKVRHIGFSAHSTGAALTALSLFPFDSVLFPLNATAFVGGKFGDEILSAAQSAGAGCLALKAMARSRWPDGADRSLAPHCWYEPQSDPAEAELFLRWTLSQPVTAAIPPGDPTLFAWAVEFAGRFAPLSEEERIALETRAARIAPLFPL